MDWESFDVVVVGGGHAGAEAAVAAAARIDLGVAFTRRLLLFTTVRTELRKALLRLPSISSKRFFTVSLPIATVSGLALFTGLAAALELIKPLLIFAIFVISLKFEFLILKVKSKIRRLRVFGYVAKEAI